MKFNIFLVVCGFTLAPCMCQFGDMLGLMVMTGMGAGGTGQISPMVRDSVTRAVHFIVGPSAIPDAEILNLASRIGREPNNMMEMMNYIPHLERIARTTYGPFLATIASDNPANRGQSTSSSSNTNTGTQRRTLAQLYEELRGMVNQRAAQWMIQQNAGGGMGAGSGMSGMEFLVPALML